MTASMRVALGQFAIQPDWPDNLSICAGLVARSAAAGAGLLVLPEGVLSRRDGDAEQVAENAQPINGPFITGLQAALADHDLTVVAGIHEPAATGTHNTLVALDRQRILAVYRKLHLYDAFGHRESDKIVAGDDGPAVFGCRGFQVGLMTCYDVRFPEVARLLADQGAELLVLPAAWVRGPHKEHHWEVMITARAIENTCYVAAVGDCGQRNIGHSMVADPLGVVITRLGEQPGLAIADVDAGRIAAARTQLPVLANRRFAVNPRVMPHPRELVNQGDGA